jgi:hypothetical protein
MTCPVLSHLPVRSHVCMRPELCGRPRWRSRLRLSGLPACAWARPVSLPSALIPGFGPVVRWLFDFRPFSHVNPAATKPRCRPAIQTAPALPSIAAFPLHAPAKSGASDVATGYSKSTIALRFQPRLRVRPGRRFSSRFCGDHAFSGPSEPNRAPRMAMAFPSSAASAHLLSARFGARTAEKTKIGHRGLSKQIRRGATLEAKGVYGITTKIPE